MLIGYKFKFIFFIFLIVVFSGTFSYATEEDDFKAALRFFNAEDYDESSILFEDFISPVNPTHSGQT